MTTSNDPSASTVPATSTSRELNDIEAEIAKYQEDCEQSFLAIGRLLLEAKEEVRKKKANWLEWLQEHVNFSICKAQRLMRVAKWMDGNEAPVPHLDFTKTYVLSRLSSKEDLNNFLEYLKPRLNGGQIEDVSKRDLQKAVSEYLLEKPRKPSTGAVTTQQKESVSAEDNFLKRFEKLQDDVLKLVGLMKENPSEYGSFATDLREFVMQHLPLEDAGDD